jgi:hypothetical protein
MLPPESPVSWDGRLRSFVATNVVDIRVHRISGLSSDFYWAMEVELGRDVVAALRDSASEIVKLRARRRPRPAPSGPTLFDEAAPAVTAGAGSRTAGGGPAIVRASGGQL